MLLLRSELQGLQLCSDTNIVTTTGSTTTTDVNKMKSICTCILVFCVISTILHTLIYFRPNNYSVKLLSRYSVTLLKN